MKQDSLTLLSDLAATADRRHQNALRRLQRAQEMVDRAAAEKVKVESAFEDAKKAK